MAEFPKFPLWTDAYLAATRHLTTMQHGIYLLLLICMWRKGGSLPRDDTRLARFAGVTRAQWLRNKDVIMEFFDLEGDVITNKRLSSEFDSVRQYSVSRKHNRRAKSLKTKKPDTPHVEHVSDICVSSESYSYRDTGSPESRTESEYMAATHVNWWAEWELFELSYPKRAGSDYAKDGRRAFESAVLSGTDPNAMRLGAERFSGWCKRNLQDPEYIPTMSTFINRGGYEDAYDVDKGDNGNDVPRILRQMKEIESRGDQRPNLEDDHRAGNAEQVSLVDRRNRSDRE